MVARPFALAFLLALPAASGLAAQAGKMNDLLDPNLATEEQLAAVPALGAELAKGIVAARPLLSQAAFHAHLTGKLKPEQLVETYRKVFVQINLNSATREEILTIPGVGQRMLGEFLEYRPYKALAQFRREIGKYVNATELARLEQYVFVPIDLNTASDEDILSIPGIGRRMLHEFKEYRPYRGIEQFRREIGKYVKPAEVARLERYVTIGAAP
ncbi:MAG: hypothetical protein ACRENB_07715 [Gemmatimonadales bacterium]